MVPLLNPERNVRASERETSNSVRLHIEENTKTTESEEENKDGKSVANRHKELRAREGLTNSMLVVEGEVLRLNGTSEYQI